MNHEELILKIQQADSANDKEFQEVISAVCERMFLIEQLAHAFGVPLITIRRWRDGKNAPLPGMRPLVFKYLLEKLQE